MENLFTQFNDIEAQKEFSSQDLNKDGKFIFSTIGYIIPILFFLPIVLKKDSSFAKFHANQQLIWLVFNIILGVISRLLAFIPLIGGFITSILGLVVLVVSILLFIAALKGYAVRIPFIGNIISIF
ncbi:MAG: DUF4870 domain-containing protein [Ruminococcus sp.]|nr:DUF4870 domain-containing protein [Ruminococcus sp.]